MAGTLAWNPIRILIGGSARRDTGTAVAGAGMIDAVEGGASVVAAADGLTSAERLEPDSKEMPALDLALMDAAPLGVDDEMPVEQAELPLDDHQEKRAGRRKKATKAEKIAEHADAVAAAINAGTDPLDAMADELPPADLLTPSPPRNVDQSRAHLDAMGQKLMDALRTFKVDGQLVGRTTGPTVTQYEIEPSPGVESPLQFAEPRERPRPQHARRVDSYRRADSREGSGWCRSAESVGGDRRVPRHDRQQGLSADAARVADRTGTRSRGTCGHRRSREDAAPAHRRRDRFGEVRLREHARHVADLPPHAEDVALPDGRPEDGRAFRVQRPSASAPQGGHRQSR